MLDSYRSVDFRNGLGGEGPLVWRKVVELLEFSGEVSLGMSREQAERDVKKKKYRQIISGLHYGAPE